MIALAPGYCLISSASRQTMDGIRSAFKLVQLRNYVISEFLFKC